MLMYVLVGLCLVLLGIAGLQFTYLAYVDRMNNERRKYLKSLEKKYADLSARLTQAERRVAEQDELLEQLSPAVTEDSWADVIEDR
jgi:t-SNARE complex subunit (syntaxin)